MQINEAIFGRRSVREYTSQPVDDQTIHELIEAAVYAPSALHQQPWTFAVVRDQKMLDEISRDAKSHMLANMTPSAQAEQIGSRRSDPDFHIFYHAARPCGSSRWSLPEPL
jgi:nitroreductase